MGVAVSFDGNYRARLWEARDYDRRAMLAELVRTAEILFGSHRDISLPLDRPFPGDGVERRRGAAEAAFAFPNLRHIAATAYHIDDVDRHRVAARVDTRSSAYRSGEAVVVGIVARTGRALACLKHSLPGDASLFRQADIDAFSIGGQDARR